MDKIIKCKKCGCDVTTTSNNRKYCDVCREEIKATYKNQEEYIEYMHGYYQRNCEAIKKYMRDRRSKDPKKVNAELKRYRIRKKRGISKKYRCGEKREYTIKDNSHILTRFGLTLDDVKKIANS